MFLGSAKHLLSDQSFRAQSERKPPRHPSRTGTIVDSATGMTQPQRVRPTVGPGVITAREIETFSQGRSSEETFAVGPMSNARNLDCLLSRGQCSHFVDLLRISCKLASLEVRQNRVNWQNNPTEVRHCSNQLVAFLFVHIQQLASPHCGVYWLSSAKLSVLEISLKQRPSSQTLTARCPIYIDMKRSSPSFQLLR